MVKSSIDARDLCLKLFAWGGALLVTSIFFFIVFDIVSRAGGINLAFLMDDPLKAGRAGGIFPILLSTTMIVLVCALVSLPVALGTALFLSLFTTRGRYASIIRTGLDLLASTPSIVFGLFGSILFCVYLGFGFSILSGGLTLAIMVLPGLVRMTEEGIRATPEEYRLNGAALGLSKVAVFYHILLPAAAPALTAALILGMARALSETAALLFTSGYVLRSPESLLDSGRSLSVHIYDLAMNVPGGDVNAYKSAAVLLAGLLLLNACALFSLHYWLKRVVV